MGELMEFLRAEGVSEALLQAAEDWKNYQPPVREAAAHRIPKPRYPYYGKEVWEEAISALLSGEHLLLAGPRPRAKTIWRRISPPCSGALSGTCRFTSTPTRPP